jgi:hypothetical protein
MAIEPTTHRKTLQYVGFAASALYLGVAGWLVATSSTPVGSLAPNELGDFLAGIFAPLAFFWLVLGFVQQGHELRNSAAALWLQSEELRNSVEQQRELVNVTREQLALDREHSLAAETEARRSAEPILSLVSRGSLEAGSDRIFRFSLVNSGRTCTSIRVISSVHLDGPKQHVSLPEHASVDVNFPMRIAEPRTVIITVTYRNARDEAGQRDFVLTPIKSGSDWNLEVMDDQPPEAT